MWPWHMLPQRQTLKDRGKSDLVPTLRATGRKRRLLPELFREDIKEEKVDKTVVLLKHQHINATVAYHKWEAHHI